jgi:predicted O-linked N-acetylglucosamine transferase (SPINDLY family)
VQITWLGYPDTTGLRAMDCRFVDAITDPVGEAEPFHTEQLVRFAPTAWIYQPPLDSPEVAPVPCTAGAPVTFGCFNNFAKVSDSTLRGWARVLASVPQSRLLLKGHGLAEPALAATLRARLALLGVGQERIELLGRTPGVAEHLALYARVDVALDTFPYHGTTTTCEALWMGVPVVTLAGDRHAARVGVSLLTAVGRREWIARDWDDYVAIAAALAKDAAGRAAWRQSLRGEMRRSALLDHAGQAARFGNAVRQCWQNWCDHQAASKQPPAPRLEPALQA